MRSRTKGKELWVLIITGSGAHSTQGPVLRGAIEALLVKRKMEYRLMKGKGSFLVNAASGIVLYDAPQPTDSKVVIAPSSGLRSTCDHISHFQAGSRTQTMSETTKELKKSFYKTFNENAAFEKAVSKSLQQIAKESMVEEKEKELLDKAYNLSLLEEQREREEEAKFNEALEASKRESSLRSLDEEEQIRKATELSKIEHDYRTDPDGCLQRVMELSRQESSSLDDQTLLMVLNNSASKCQEDQQEDEDLLKVLELSVTEF